MFANTGIHAGILLALIFLVFARLTNSNPAPQPQQMDRVDKAFQLTETTCAGEPVKVTKAMNDSVMSCAKKAKDEWAGTGKKGMMPLTRLACAGVCILQEFGLLDEAGKPTNDDKVLIEHIKMMPEKVRQSAVDTLHNCVKNNAKKLVMKTGDCSSYGLMLLCIKSSLDKICKP